MSCGKVLPASAELFVTELLTTSIIQEGRWLQDHLTLLVPIDRY
ncbi:unnamed protein product, partial [Timema podura]|nr:unnamed protein product [Timema podura]